MTKDKWSEVLHAIADGKEVKVEASDGTWITIKKTHRSQTFLISILIVLCALLVIGTAYAIVYFIKISGFIPIALIISLLIVVEVYWPKP